MKLLFAKPPYNGSTELKALLGFIDADIKFEKIKPDVITASTELVKLIGKPMYESVVGIYEADSASDEDMHLLYLTRYAIAIKAYSLLAPSNDIAHTPNGRKMRQGDTEKQAFEWMIDRDNIAQEKRYYRALDDLLIYMDESVSGWKESEAFKKSHKLFLRTTDDFNEYFPIDSRLILIKLEPGIRKCEQDEILPRIGQDKFDALKSILQSGTAPEDTTDIKLLSLIKEACAFYALSWAMMRLSVHIFPDGVLQAYTSDRNTTQASQAPLKSEAEAARQAFAEDAAKIFQKIETLLTPLPEQTPDCNEELPGFIAGTKFIST